MLGFRFRDKDVGRIGGMKLGLVALTLPFVLATACGGDDDEDVPIDAAAIDAAATIDGDADAPSIVDAPAIDAPPVIDAPSSVQVIPNCTGVQNPAVTVSAASGAYVPQNPTLQVNQILRFEPGSPVHDMAAVNGEFGTTLGQIACLRFTAPGTFPVHCSIHGFSGTITVN